MRRFFVASLLFLCSATTVLAYAPNANIGFVHPRPDTDLPFGEVPIQLVTAGFDVPDEGVILLWLDEVTGDAARATMILESTASALTNVAPGEHTLYAGLLPSDRDEPLGARASVTFTVLEPPPDPQSYEPPKPPKVVSNVLFPNTPAMILLLSVVVIGVLVLLYRIISQGDEDSEENGSPQKEE